jgi:hypothetical protein
MTSIRILRLCFGRHLRISLGRFQIITEKLFESREWSAFFLGMDSLGIVELEEGL